ncbi:hypothetical protein GCM10011600_19010 [Pseudolysinimonas yzui]|uniref:Uncharacterized protein n=1 Tax=Pseudolysinimonas yzui TaxID=2708254 RepID=A0A8J3GR89_9MICO|nr:hypothetical protein GCM10011600_19010 [Pseudolysinimonas yzui]
MSVSRPEHVLLNAYRVLHGRGAHRIQAAPYFYATGHWRCSTLVDGEQVLKYTNGWGWHLPGLAAEAVVDAEQEADAIWAALTPEQQAAAMRPDPAYVVWFSALLDACGDTVPALWDDYDNFLRDGYVWIGTGRVFPLPPGDSLRAYT